MPKAKRLPKINPYALPDFRTFCVITTPDELKTFLNDLRQDYYSPKKLEEEGLLTRFRTWLNRRKRRAVFFLAVFDEKDDLVKNDGWGHYEIYACSAIRLPEGSINVNKEKITDFYH